MGQQLVRAKKKPPGRDDPGGRGLVPVLLDPLLDELVIEGDGGFDLVTEDAFVRVDDEAVDEVHEVATLDIAQVELSFVVVHELAQEREAGALVGEHLVQRHDHGAAIVHGPVGAGDPVLVDLGGGHDPGCELGELVDQGCCGGDQFFSLVLVLAGCRTCAR